MEETLQKCCGSMPFAHTKTACRSWYQHCHSDHCPAAESTEREFTASEKPGVVVHVLTCL